MGAQHVVALQHFVAAQQQFGKIDHAFAAAQRVVFGVILDQAAGVRIGRFQCFGAQPAFLLRVDKALQGARGDDFFGNAGAFEQAFDQGELVAGIENLKTLRQAGVAVVLAQETVAQAVEGAQPHRPQVVGQHRPQPRLHFLGGLVGKGNRHNAVHVGLSRLHQPGDAGGEHAGFAAARPRQHQRRLRRPGNGGKLLGVEMVQKAGVCAGKHGFRLPEKEKRRLYSKGSLKTRIRFSGCLAAGKKRRKSKVKSVFQAA